MSGWLTSDKKEINLSKGCALSWDEGAGKEIIKPELNELLDFEGEINTLGRAMKYLKNALRNTPSGLDYSSGKIVNRGLDEFEKTLAGALTKLSSAYQDLSEIKNRVRRK